MIDLFFRTLKILAKLRSLSSDVIVIAFIYCRRDKFIARDKIKQSSTIINGKAMSFTRSVALFIMVLEVSTTICRDSLPWRIQYGLSFI